MMEEGSAYSATKDGKLHSVIIERNDKRRLCYFKYCEDKDKYKYVEILKPSSVADRHLKYIKSIKNWRHD